MADRKSLYDILAAILFGTLIFCLFGGMHIYARHFVEPPAEKADECTDPNARPGSRAQVMSTSAG